VSADATAFERGVAPLLEKLLPEKLSDVLSFKPDPKLQQRIDQLAGKSTEGELTNEERAEYEGYVRANKFIAVLRREALKLSGATS
jgi:hypothetical protein